MPKFHVELSRFTLQVREPAAESGNLPAPTRRLHDEIVQIARRYTRDARGLRERSRPHRLQLLPRFRRQAAQLEVGQVWWQCKRSQLRQPGGRFPLPREVSVVLQFDF